MPEPQTRAAGPAARHTRRGAIAAGAASARRSAVAAGLGAAALALGAPPAGAREAREGEALTGLVRAEEDAAFAYRGAGLERAAVLAAHDIAHARGLAAHLEALGMPIPGAPRDRGDLPPEALAVLETGGGEAGRRAAIVLERSLIAGCRRALPELEDPNTVRTVATVLASHAQHLLLHELAGGG